MSALRRPRGAPLVTALLTLLIAGCDTLTGRVVLVGDSIWTTTSDTLITRAYQVGAHLEFVSHGATPIGSNAFFQDWTTTYWVPRALELQHAGILPADCVVLSLGTNDPPADPPDPSEVVALDIAYGEPYWLLPLVRPTSRAVIEQWVPAGRLLDVPYSLGPDGLHPDADGAAMIAEAVMDACEAGS